MTNPKGKRRALSLWSVGLLQNIELFLQPHTCESSRRVIL
ncbi:rCG41080 [Rattus norvegicus]|uniref:RCG41080 n=1 Tax=Rattus norvegicus TaxID=10116 RepID=A6K259_RAT|nr:rCG41080 [Rattus norvegicus]